MIEAPTPALASPETSTPAPDSRRVRIAELALVVGVGFLGSSLSSLRDWLLGNSPPPWTPFGELLRSLQAGLAIAVLAYVLYRQGRGLRAIGLTFRASDVAWALPLVFFSHLLTLATIRLLHAYSVHLPTVPHSVPSELYWLAILPLAAKEELIVRGYLMTEVSALTGSMPFAVFASIVFQSFYHLYQGTPAFFVHLGGFFAFAVFYATTRRITPVILAHAFYNFWLLTR
jgi:membrane protease YdiL (CAAX protease family)